MVGFSLETPVGTPLISTLPQWTFRREVTKLMSGSEAEIAEVRRCEAAKRCVHVVSGPAKMTRFPLEVHLVAETRTLAKVGAEARAELQTGTMAGAKILAVDLRVQSAE